MQKTMETRRLSEDELYMSRDEYLSLCGKSLAKYENETYQEALIKYESLYSVFGIPTEAEWAESNACIIATYKAAIANNQL